MLAVAAVSCNKETESPEGGPAVFRIATRSTTDLGTLMQGKTVAITCYATTEDTGVRGQLTATFKAMPEAAAPYLNDTTEVLPVDCYSFTTNDVVIDRYNKNSRTGELKVSYNASLTGGKAYVLPVALAQVSGSDKASADPSRVIVIRFYAKKGDITRPQGTGSQFDPYLIYDADGLKEISARTNTVTFNSRDEYLAAQTTYFKLVNDIDLGGADWTPIDILMDKQKCQKFDFNGNGKTISNFKASGVERVGLFTNITGSVYDLRITGAEITVTGKKAGILAGQASSGDFIWSTIARCYVQGKVSCPNGSNVDQEVSLGGLLGQQCYGDLYECEADVEIMLGGNNKEHYVGGIVGSLGKKELVIRDCITKGKYYSKDGSNTYMFGGIIGCAQNSTNLIQNCISLADIKCCDMAGGIIGELNHNNVDTTGDNDSDYTSIVQGCLAWNDAIVNTSASAQYGPGAIAGWCYAAGFSKNFRRPGLTFTDDEDVEPSVTFKHRAFNGKAADAGKSASQVAREIGWDETIWDLSGEVPALKCLQ